MKSALYGIVVLLLLNAGSVARAEEEKGGTEVTAALKAWVNEWKHDDPAAGRKISDSVATLVGPAVGVKLKTYIVLGPEDRKFPTACCRELQ